MQKLIMEKHVNFQEKVEEINRVLKDGWDIFEGPFLVGEYICIKFSKYEPDNNMSSELVDDKEDDHQW